MRIGEVRHPERARWGKPLDGVRVLSLEQMQALPYATQLMSHLGADVVKVEHPVHGESGRASRPALTDDDDRPVGATFLRNNLNKRSIGIDLKRDEGRDLVRRLTPHFDVVAENFRPGTLTRLGLDHAALAPLHDGLIYVSVSGFGNTTDSPYRDWPSYAPIPEAMAGFYEAHRTGDEPPPVLVAGALGDIGTALFAVIGILSALRHRERTGLGQYVDIAMYDSMIAMADMVPFMASMGAPPVPAGGGALGIIAGFRAKDGWFVIEIVREHQFERFARLIGQPEWCDDERFATREGWFRQRETLVRPALEAWAASRTKLEACAELCAHGIAAGPSNDAADIAADPHVAQRDMLVEVPRPDGGEPLRVVGNPVKLTRVAEGPIASFPRLGEHTDEVLEGLLGLGAAERAALRADGVIT